MGKAFRKKIQTVRMILFILLLGSAASCNVYAKTADQLTVSGFLKEVAAVQEYARTHGYEYGHSTAVNPTTDGKIACDRLVSKALYNLGFTDQPKGGITIVNIDHYLSAWGFERSTSLEYAKAGSIMLVWHKTTDPIKHPYPSHVFVLASDFNTSTMTADRYDCGSNTFIRSQQPLRGLGFWYRTDPVVVYSVPEIRLRLPRTEDMVYRGETISLDAKLEPSSVDRSRLIYTSSDPTVASVDASGNVTGLKKGSSVITVRVTGTQQYARCRVTVENVPVFMISLNTAKKVLRKGQKYSLTATIFPDNAYNKKVRWKSSNSSVVSVSRKGVIKAKREGSAVITAISSNGLDVTCKVVSGIPVKKIRLSKKSIRLGSRRSFKLKAVIKPANATDKKVYWISSDPKVATVKKGLVVAKGKGSCIIKARTRDGHLLSTCKVKVLK